MPDEAAQRNSPFTFVSTLDPTHRPALERLFFFNPRQHEQLQAIQATIALSGLPAIVEAAGGLSIQVPSGAFQCLFMLETATDELLGAALYGRPEPRTLWVAHLAAAPLHPLDPSVPAIATALIGRIAQIGQTLRGVDRVQLPYQPRRFLRLSQITP